MRKESAQAIQGVRSTKVFCAAVNVVFVVAGDDGGGIGRFTTGLSVSSSSSRPEQVKPATRNE